MWCIFRVLKDYHALDFIITHVTTEISNVKLDYSVFIVTYRVGLMFEVDNCLKKKLCQQKLHSR
jgi:hypothetical protein